jgi:hypothetical protein
MHLLCASLVRRWSSQQRVKKKRSSPSSNTYSSTSITSCVSCFSSFHSLHVFYSFIVVISYSKALYQVPRADTADYGVLSLPCISFFPSTLPLSLSVLSRLLFIRLKRHTLRSFIVRTLVHRSSTFIIDSLQLLPLRPQPTCTCSSTDAAWPA